MTPRDGVNGPFLEIQEEIKMEYEKGYVFDLSICKKINIIIIKKILNLVKNI